MSKVMSCGLEECLHNQYMNCHAGGIEVRSSTKDRKVGMGSFMKLISFIL